MPDLFSPFDEQRPGYRIEIWDGSRFVAWSWDEWRTQALSVAGGLRAAGVRPGDRVGAVLSNSPAGCAFALGAWLAGASIVSLPAEARGMQTSAYVEQLRLLASQTEPELICAGGEKVSLLSGHGLPVRAFESLLGAKPLAEAAPPAAGDEVFIQYSSGSTADPRGCRLTAEAVALQLASLAAARRIDPEVDREAIWLPLSHDMGFFGCLMLSYFAGHRITVSSPERFSADPVSWLEDIRRCDGNLTACPNFALEILARHVRVRRPPLPERFKQCVVSSEPVLPATLDRAAAIFPAGSLVAAYGLAEAVVAVTMAETGEGPRFRFLDRQAFASGDLLDTDPDDERAIGLVSNGRPIPGSSVEIASEHGEFGEVVVSAPNLAAGYVGRPELSASVFAGGKLHTGDLGFVDDGELFVCGRLDDMIVVGGNNVFARDIEAVLSQMPELRPGCYAVIGVRRRERTMLALLAELREPDASPRRVLERASRCSVRTVGLPIVQACFLPAGTLPKTPSGKVQRFRCLELLDDPPAGSGSAGSR